MIPYILCLFLVTTTYADTWLTDGQTLGSAGTVSEVEFENGVRLSGSSNGVSVLIGTNLYPLLKEGDVPAPDLPVFDDFSIVDQPTGAKGVAARYDLNDALFAWTLSQFESTTIGMVDGWFWSPDSVDGLATLGGSTFATNQGVRNYAPAPSWAMQFDGSDDYAQSINDHGMSNGTYSVQAWVYRMGDLGNDSYVTFGHNACNASLGLITYGSEWVFDGACSELYAAPTPGTLGNQWLHYVGVYSNGAGTLFINGSGVAAGSMSITLDGTGPIWFGGNRVGNGEHYVEGLMDELVLWERALSTDEVASLYNGGAGYYLTTNDALAASAVAIYHFDEGTGDTTEDASIYGNDATAYEGPTWAPGHVAGPSGAPTGTTNLTESINLDFVPATVRGIVMTKAEVALTTNDFILAVSRDNGGTWNSIALAESAYPSSDSTYQLFAGLVAVTNQPSGTQIVFRVTQSATAAQTLCGVGGSWR